jgi:hypothetical protein
VVVVVVAVTVLPMYDCRLPVFKGLSSFLPYVGCFMLLSALLEKHSVALRHMHDPAAVHPLAEPVAR